MHLRILILCLASCAFANAEILSFDACVREAASSNRDLLAQISAVKSLEFQYNAAYSGFYPQLSASLNANYANAASQIGWTVSPAISLNQNLFAGYADVAKVNLACANLEAARADLAATKAKISSDLKNAFAALVYAQNSVKLGENIKTRRESNNRLVSLLFDSGRENYGSVLLAKAYVDQAEFQIFQAKNGLRAASVLLAKILGRDLSEDLRVTGPLPQAEPESNPDFYALSQLVPDYVKAIALEKASAAQKLSARAPFFPSIDFQSNAGVSARSDQTNGQWLVGFSVSWPFFSGGRDYYGLKAATQSLTTAQLNKVAIQKNDTSILAAAYRAYIESIRQLEVDRSFRGALEIQAKIATADYNNGFLTFQNWDIFETGYITRQLTVLVDERNLVSANAAWELAKGIGVIP
jgi:outer membrane protein